MFDNKQIEIILILQPKGNFIIDWRDSENENTEEKIAFEENLYGKFMKNKLKAAFLLGFNQNSNLMSESVHFLYSISKLFIEKAAKTADIEVLREDAKIEITDEEIEDILRDAPFLYNGDYLDFSWIMSLFLDLKKVFCSEIKNYKGKVSDYFSVYSSNINVVGKIFFHLVENKNDEYPFAFLSTYSTVQNGKPIHLPLKNALTEYKNDNKKLLELLSTVNKAASNSKFIEELIESGEIFYPLKLTTKEAYTFLKEIPVYEEAGILCRIPNWWKNASQSPKVSVRIGEKNPSVVGFGAILDFNAQLSLGGEVLTEEEFKMILDKSEGLAFIKGKWVEVDREKLKEALLAYEKAKKYLKDKNMNIVEALRFQLNAGNELEINDKNCDFEINNGQWLENVITNLQKPEKMASITVGDNFNATLRSYQEKGLQWLYYMKSIGLGACLADDMGLGKTIQIIALLNYIKSKRHEKTLLIVPASITGNWAGEIYKFAPDLKFFLIHPSMGSAIKPLSEEILQENNIFITTYGMTLRLPWLLDIYWDNVILDEAQAIKNPSTKQTQTIKQLKAGYKIALTGTPIENRLFDLWSVFDFLNKGLLGTAKEFGSFSKRIKEEHGGYSKLKKVVNPFILRRLKTDKSIISDLPEKIEMKTYSNLSKKQAAIYESLVNEIEEKLYNLSGDSIERKGLILASILKFKQICNHPDHYLGQAAYDESESGKFSRLREICETIYEKKERVLVFTQFREITEPLKNFFESIFMHKGLVLHGGTAVAKRKELVDRFCGEEYVPFMILSLKAGGVGLNLTSANHVVHFDRWWNPAVENQATDRAFRIGQKKNVLVHKFITKGTIEEKIDLMIEQKTKLSSEIISDMQESWITEMDNKQLMDLFRLNR